MRPATGARDLLVRGSAGALVLRLAGALLAFGLQLLLARVLGHSQYGNFIFAFATVTTLSLILKLGFDTATLRFLPGYRAGGQWELARGLLRESSRVVWALAVCVALGLAAVAALVRPGADPGLAWTLCIAAAALPLLTVQHLAEARLRAIDRLTLARVPPELIQPVLIGVFVLSPGRGGIGAEAAMVYTLIACAVTLLASTLAFRRAAPAPLFSGPARRESREWHRASLQLALYSTTMLVIGQVDVVIAGILLGPEAAAGYAIASRISKFIPFGLTAVNLAFAPLAAALFHDGRTRELQRVVTWAAGGILLTTLPLGAGVILYREPLLALFGAEFVAAQGALVILAIGRLVNAACGPTATLLSMSGHHGDAARVALGSALLDAALLLVLIPWLGVVGTALATTLTIVAWNLALLFLVRRRLGVRPTLFALLRARGGADAGA
jgi:O-antigen/teichoic acid export membrane protein